MFLNNLGLFFPTYIYKKYEMNTHQRKLSLRLIRDQACCDFSLSVTQVFNYLKCCK